MKTTTREDIRACPHCEGRGQIVTSNVSFDGNVTRVAYVRCASCGARTRYFKRPVYGDEFVERAVAAWNMRAEDWYEVIGDGEERNAEN